MDHISPHPKESRSWHLLRYSLQSTPLILVSSVAPGVAHAQAIDAPSSLEINPSQHPVQQSVSEFENSPVLVTTSIAPESFAVAETTRVAAAEPTAFSHHSSVEMMQSIPSEAIAQPTFSESLPLAPPLIQQSAAEVAQITIPENVVPNSERRPSDFFPVPQVESPSQPDLNQPIENTPTLDPAIGESTIRVTGFRFVFGRINDACVEAPDPSPPMLFSEQDLLQRIHLIVREERILFEAEEKAEESRSPTIEDFLYNRPLSISQLVQVATAVADFYDSEGYGASGAVVCVPQATRDSGRGEIVIRVIEGQLENVQTFRVSEAENREPNSNGESETADNSNSTSSEPGSNQANPEESREGAREGEGDRDRPTRLEHYVESRLGVEEGEPLNVARLQERLALLQLSDPLIDGISARLSAGFEPGNSRLRIEVNEADPFTLFTSMDNARAPSIGSVQRQVQVGYNNVLRLGDSLGVGYTNTDGSNGFDTSYTIPLNPNNGTLALRYSTSSSDVIEPPFDELDIESMSQTYDLTYRQPIIRRICQLPQLNNPNCPYDREEANRDRQQPRSPIFEEFTIGVTASLRDSQTSLLGDPFPLSLGADEDGRSRVSALRFFQEWTQQSDRSVFAVRSQFNVGLNVLGATVQESVGGGDIPDSRFVSWQGQAQWVRVLNDEDDRYRDTLLTLRANAQLSDQSLLSSEQFAIGGLGTVRGYRQDTLQSDNGLFASAELQFPLVRVRERAQSWSGSLYLVPFIDAGFGWNNGNRPDPDPGVLASVGVGLQWRMRNPNITARLDWGIPLVSIDGRRDRTWQENGLHFSVSFGL